MDGFNIKSFKIKGPLCMPVFALLGFCVQIETSLRAHRLCASIIHVLSLWIMTCSSTAIVRIVCLAKSAKYLNTFATPVIKHSHWFGHLQGIPRPRNKCQLKVTTRLDLKAAFYFSIDINSYTSMCVSVCLAVHLCFLTPTVSMWNVTLGILSPVLHKSFSRFSKWPSCECVCGSISALLIMRKHMCWAGYSAVR